MAEILGRIFQRQETGLPSSITAPATLSVDGPIATASATAPLTVSTFSFNGSVRPQTIAVNPSEVSSSTSVAPTSTHTNADAASKTKAVATSTSTSDASRTAPSNLNILIPAIVAPVAAVLIISFVAFWLYMRRRQKKAIESEPEFVMEGMKEKPFNRPITADSNSSTQELVPAKTNNITTNVREVERPATAKEVNFMPPRLESAMDSRPGSRQADATGRSKAVPNFSRGPRPNTAGREAAPSPAPGMDQRDRGGSRAGKYPPPTGPMAPRPNNGPQGPNRIDPPPAIISRPHQTRNGSFSRPLGPPLNQNRNQPAPIATKPNRPSQDEAIRQPPTGAYNGSSPISQYSPIVKEMPKFGTSPMVPKPNSQPRPAGGSISSIGDQGNRKAPPSAIKTSNTPLISNESSFADGNLRTARTGNNPRLGFHSIVATTAATSPATEEPPTPSPRLPPPATRDAPPTNYNIPLPAHEPPAPASIQARLNGASVSDRRSVVSGLSDDYVDMEVDDNKSDVSSLDEREKWQMQSDSERANSRQAGLAGYGGLSARPPLLTSDSRAHSHTSEASGSQYSLGYYTKDSSGRDSR